MANVTWQNVYGEYSGLYDELVSVEDFRGNLLAALEKIQPFDQLEVAEFGAGTGRLTAHLIPLARTVCAFDLTPAMVARAHQKLQRLQRANWVFGVADSRKMPLPTAWADVAIEGWSIAQIMSWNMERWQTEVEAALNEMVRVVRPGGVVILIETLGTGATTPQPPERFAPLYAWFETRWQASHQWIRTDFRFPSRAAAQRAAGSLFGEAIAQGWETPEGFVLPECTGIWWFRR